MDGAVWKLRCGFLHMVEVEFVAFLCQVWVDYMGYHVFLAFDGNIVQLVFEYEYFFLQAVQTEHAPEGVIASHAEAAFWQFHRFIVVIIGLEEVEEQHELVFHVVIEESCRNACHLATVRTMIHKQFVREYLFSEFRIQVHID